GRPGDAGEDVAQSDVLGRIVIGERLKKRSTQQFHVDGRVVLVILDAIEFEQAEGDLVVNQLPIGCVLNAERAKWRLGVETLAPMRIEATLFRHAGDTYIVEQRIERDGFARLR